MLGAQLGMAHMAYSTPRITPYLWYDDVGAALDWLAKAFGLHERHRDAGPDGTVMHAEMTLGDDGLIMMGCPGAQYRSPKRLGQLYVRIEDLDAHFERAVAAGAVVLERPADQPYGDRRYAVEDPYGHRWYFAQSISRAV